MQDKNKVIGLFGGCGYIGSLLAKRWLDNGNKIVIIDNLFYDQGPLVSEVLLHKNCEFIKMDAEDANQELTDRLDILYLLHAYVGAPLADALPEKEVRRVNVESIRKIISKCNQNQRIIGVCTNSGYGSTDEVCTELTPMKSISLYGKTKEEAESIIMTHPKASVFRLATVWGRGMRNRIDLMVNNFTYLLTCTNKLELFQGNFKRNFVHVDDVVDLFFYIVSDSRTFGEVYNFGQDEDNTSKEELANFIVSQFNNAQLTFSSQVDKDCRNYNCSSLKLRNLGYWAKKTIKNDIKELIEFYKLFPLYGTDNHKKFVSLMKNY